MLYDAFETIQSLIGEPEFIQASDADTTKKSESAEPSSVVVTKNIVLADGTYATVTKTETTNTPETENVQFIRNFILEGHGLLISSLVTSLTKFSLRAKGRDAYAMTMRTLLCITGIAKMIESSPKRSKTYLVDCLNTISFCCRILLDPNVKSVVAPLFLKNCHESYSKFVAAEKLSKSGNGNQSTKQNCVSQPDDLIQFRQLRAQAVQGGIEVDLMDADDISRAVGSDGGSQESSRLKRVHQLTGFSDPVYAEATMTVHDYDILLDILVINRTPNTLTNVSLELATMGDLKIVERPQMFTIGPLDEKKMKANIKVSSTETGHIFGTIVFDNASNAQKSYVTLNDIQLDIMDYIRPGVCKPQDFSKMWAEFEWENKVTFFCSILISFLTCFFILIRWWSILILRI